MSEFELGILRQRAQEAYRQKVLRGEVLTIVPIGFIRSHSNRIEMTPDREVQEAVRRVFSDFERFGTLRQVLLWYHQENITIPLARAGEGRRANGVAIAQLSASVANAQKSHLRRGFRLWPDSMSNGGRRGSFAKTWRAQSGDGKLASLAKGSPSGIYLLGTILGKPTHPEIESNEIPRCKFRSG